MTLNTQPVPAIPTTKKCIKCAQEIPADAKLCYHCSSSQYGIASKINNPIEKGSLLVSIVVLFLSIAQFFDSRADKTKADEALDKANKYEAATRQMFLQVDSLRASTKEYQQQALQIALEVSKTQKNIDSLALQTKNVILTSLRNEWLQANQSLFALNPDSRAAKRFVQNIDIAVKAILKDSSAVKQWWKATAAQKD